MDDLNKVSLDEARRLMREYREELARNPVPKDEIILLITTSILMEYAVHMRMGMFPEEEASCQRTENPDGWLASYFFDYGLRSGALISETFILTDEDIDEAELYFRAFTFGDE